jgi:hypothetical protein
VFKTFLPYDMLHAYTFCQHFMISVANVMCVRNGKGRQHFNMRRYTSVYFPSIVQENCQNEIEITDSERQIFSSYFSFHMG